MAMPAPKRTWVVPSSPPLDEAEWNAWLARGDAHYHRRLVTVLKVVKSICVATLLGVAALGVYLSAYEVVPRFIVTAGSLLVMIQTLRCRRKVAMGVFVAMALLYNPILPVFSFSGEWQRSLVALSALPFVIALGWRSVEPEKKDN